MRNKQNQKFRNSLKFEYNIIDKIYNKLQDKNIFIYLNL